MTTGLFGQYVVDPMRAEQMRLFHEPVVMPEPMMSREDRRLADKFDPADTPRLPGDSFMDAAED